MERPRDRRVLYVSALPPPGGGVATWTRILFDRGLGPGWTAALVDTRLSHQRRTLTSGRFSAAELWRNGRILLSLLRELVLRRPDLVHFNVGSFDLGLVRDTAGATLARAFGVPCVFHYHGNPGEPLGDGDAPSQRLLRWALRVGDLHIVMNQPSLDFLASLARAGAERVVSLPNFFDESRLPEIRDGARQPDAPKRVIFAAALNIAKGTTRVLAVARALPHVEFLLLGPVYEETRAELERSPANAHVHSEADHATVLEEMARSDLLLLPTVHPEGFPYAVLEAMALGLPVVATPVGAIPEMIEAGRGGLLCPPEPDALAAAARQLLDDEVLGRAAGLFNREKSHRLYSYAAVRPRLIALYERVLASRGRAADPA